jgi:hypothetical protein
MRELIRLWGLLWLSQGPVFRDYLGTSWHHTLTLVGQVETDEGPHYLFTGMPRPRPT